MLVNQVVVVCVVVGQLAVVLLCMLGRGTVVG